MNQGMWNDYSAEATTAPSLPNPVGQVRRGCLPSRYFGLGRMAPASKSTHIPTGIHQPLLRNAQ